MMMRRQERVERAGEPEVGGERVRTAVGMELNGVKMQRGFMFVTLMCRHSNLQLGSSSVCPHTPDSTIRHYH